jgi:hypothetical protein
VRGRFFRIFIQLVQVSIGLEADLPVAEQDVIVGLAVLVLPLALVGRLGALPLIVLRPILRVLEPRLVAGDAVGLDIPGVIGGDIPEGPLLRPRCCQ